MDRLPFTPKAGDLTDHFGTEPAHDVYGPKLIQNNKLVREGISGKDTIITPITNFNQEINPIEVVSGDLLNTSFDASKIIRPIMAGRFFILLHLFNYFLISLFEFF